MQDLSEIFATIKHLFDEQQFCFEPTELYEPIDYTLRLGGKRLRPALLLASNQMMGGEMEQAMSAAVGIETFHNFTLLHDDVMDRSPLRRGQPTVWTRWDENTAILSGDTMFALAWRYFLKKPHANLQAILDCFNETAIEVCEGQQYDMNFERRDEVPLDEYMMMIRKKTAVLLAGAMKIGAMYAGADEEDLRHLYDCGINMGLAFQIQDDLLDAYADQNTFGKPIGQDIRDHKKTYMILHALELCNPTERVELKSLYNTDRHDEKSVNAVLEKYDKLGMKAHAEEEIVRLMKIAENELAEVKASDERKTPIKELISTLIGRQR
jgi:geranylgeranyl diphosphate synthase type II